MPHTFARELLCAPVEIDNAQRLLRKLIDPLRVVPDVHGGLELHEAAERSHVLE